MTEALPNYPRVLAIDPIWSGFAYAVFEGPDNLLDWGILYIEERRPFAPRLENLMERYAPGVLVLEDCNRSNSRRCSNARRLIADAALVAHRHGIRTARFTRAAIKRFFSYTGKARKHEIALAIAEGFPELAPRLPRVRKIWMSEAQRMSIFDAASLALVYYGVRPQTTKDLAEAA